MPLETQPNGFIVTYARQKCALFGTAMFFFAALMILAGANIFVPILDGTALDWIKPDRRPPWLWGGVLITGGGVLTYVSLWNIRAAFGDAIAMRFDDQGVATTTFIGRRFIRWDDIGEVMLRNGAIFFHPRPESAAKPVPLTSFLTSVSNQELRSALAGFKPDLLTAIDAS